MTMRLRVRKYRIEGIELPVDAEIQVDLEEGERIVQISMQAGGMPEYGYNVRVWTERSSDGPA